MGTHLVFAACLCFSSVTASTVAYSNKGPGTTPNITDVVAGRCQEYRQCLMGDPCLPSYRRVNCADTVDAFMTGIRYMDPCGTPDNVYDEFLALVPPTTTRDKTMFWSGVAGANIPQDIAQVTPEFTVLEETFPGFLAGNLSWCGTTDRDDPTGLNFTVCPTWRSADCPNNTKAAFWDRASGLLAQQAEGQTYVVLNSQRQGGAFNLNSVFAQIEAPNLDPSKVTSVALYLIPDFTLPVPNESFRETCYNGSIIQLKNLLSNMGFNHTCEEDPTIVMWLQCARYPDSPYCAPYSGSTLVTSSFVLLFIHFVVAISLSGWNTS